MLITLFESLTYKKIGFSARRLSVHLCKKVNHAYTCTSRHLIPDLT